MKKYKKTATLLSVLLVLLSTVVYLNAKEKDLNVEYTDFKYVTRDYNPKAVHIAYNKTDSKEEASVIDNKTGDVLETMTVTKLKETGNTYPYMFTRSKVLGGTTVDFNVLVEIYEKGSFRQINSYQNSYLQIKKAVTRTYIEDYNANVWSPKGYPSVELFYAYNCTLNAEVYTGDDASVVSDLLEGGFNEMYTDGNKIYFSQILNSVGTIKLY